MKHGNLKVQIIAYTDDSQPGWVKCCFKDTNGLVHLFEEKAPIVSEKFLDEKSSYPQEGILRCTISHIKSDVVTIDIGVPLCQEDENGQSVFQVYATQIVEG